MSDDSWGCALTAIALLVGGVWAYNNYEIKRRDSVVEAPIVSTVTARRPTGSYAITETASGSIHRLNADSVRGDRRHRQGWVIVDASKDKSAKNWRHRHVLYLVDCETTAIRELSSIFYNAEGESPWPGDHSDAQDANPQYYPPGTVGYAPVRALCVDEFDEAKPAAPL